MITELRRVDHLFSHLPAYDKHALYALVIERTDIMVAVLAIHRNGAGVRSPKGAFIRSCGGIRKRNYAVLGPGLPLLSRKEADERAVTDVLRLSAAMTIKSAGLGVPIGGAKMVILAHNLPDPYDATHWDLCWQIAVHFLHPHAEHPDLGTYCAAEDMGTTHEDMAYIDSWASPGTVAGCSHATNPSPETARGVHAGIRESIAWRFGDGYPISSASFMLQGAAGSVGSALLAMLWQSGARDIAVSERDDPEAQKRLRELIADKPGIRVLAPSHDVLLTGKQVFVPCAMGGVIDAPAIRRLQAAPAQLRPIIVAGCANNVLGTIEEGDLLSEMGILYAYDSFINAGGLAEVYISEALVPGTMDSMIGCIRKNLRATFEGSIAQGIAPARVAEQMLAERLKEYTLPA